MIISREVSSLLKLRFESFWLPLSQRLIITWYLKKVKCKFWDGYGHSSPHYYGLSNALKMIQGNLTSLNHLRYCQGT